MEIVPYSAATHGPAVERFNAALAAGGAEFRFPAEEPAPRGPDPCVWYEHFVATEGDAVFGGYLLKHQTFFLGDAPAEVDNLQLPLSLGLIDNRYSHVSAALLFDALGRNELLYCLGMGSQDSRIVKLLAAAGWQHRVVPFWFRVRSGNRFARHIRLPAGRAWTQRALRLAGRLRFAGAGLWALNAVRRTAAPARAEGQAEEAERFDSLADDLFAEHAAGYALLGDRRAGALNSWYPPGDARYRRLVVRQAGRAVGWAVVLDTPMRGHKYFGDLRVGTLADGFARPGHAATVVAAAERFLSARGVDLIVSNQLHPEWGEALAQAGYRRGPSNFFFYFSPGLAERLAERPGWEGRIHMNRGDGDGPIHL